jgi:hypothetical protein
MHRRNVDEGTQQSASIRITATAVQDTGDIAEVLRDGNSKTPLDSPFSITTHSLSSCSNRILLTVLRSYHLPISLFPNPQDLSTQNSPSLSVFKPHPTMINSSHHKSNTHTIPGTPHPFTLFSTLPSLHCSCSSQVTLLPPSRLFSLANLFSQTSTYPLLQILPRSSLNDQGILSEKIPLRCFALTETWKSGVNKHPRDLEILEVNFF